LKSLEKVNIQQKSPQRTIREPFLESKFENILSLESNEDSIIDSNIEELSKEINELKNLCKTQGEALMQFQETMETSKEDNHRLKDALNRIENEKKKKPDFLIDSEMNSAIFDNIASPVVNRSCNSSMFISFIEELSFPKELHDEFEKNFKLKKLHYNFLDAVLLSSHITTLKI
jgi:uncharacterized protein YukE